MVNAIGLYSHPLKYGKKEESQGKEIEWLGLKWINHHYIIVVEYIFLILF